VVVHPAQQCHLGREIHKCSAPERIEEKEKEEEEEEEERSKESGVEEGRTDGERQIYIYIHVAQ
jgi:hypothetical protein